VQDSAYLVHVKDAVPYKSSGTIYKINKIYISSEFKASHALQLVFRKDAW